MKNLFVFQDILTKLSHCVCWYSFKQPDQIWYKMDRSGPIGSKFGKKYLLRINETVSNTICEFGWDIFTNKVFHTKCWFWTDRSYGIYVIDIVSRSDRLRHMFCVKQSDEPELSVIKIASKPKVYCA